MSVGTELTTSTFDEFVRSSDRPVLVDFWAEWCGPCKQFDPILAAFAERHPGVALASVDIDAQPELTVRFGVMSAPTVLLLSPDGDTRWRAVGARSLSRLTDEVEPHLG